LQALSNSMERSRFPKKLTDHEIIEKFPAFYRTRIFLLSAQYPVICPYPMPDESSQFLPSHFLICLNINVPFTHRSFQVVSFSPVSHTNTASYQEISPVFRNMITCYVEKLLASNTNPHLVGLMLLLIQYIRSCPPYW
jgi:hypothetical protein